MSGRFACLATIPALVLGIAGCNDGIQPGIPEDGKTYVPPSSIPGMPDTAKIEEYMKGTRKIQKQPPKAQATPAKGEPMPVQGQPSPGL
jgi:hypothetical protein